MTNNRVIRDNDTGELVIAVESNLLDFHIGKNPIIYEVDDVVFKEVIPDYNKFKFAIEVW